MRRHDAPDLTTAAGVAIVMAWVAICAVALGLVILSQPSAVCGCRPEAPTVYDRPTTVIEGALP